MSIYDEWAEDHAGIMAEVPWLLDGCAFINPKYAQRKLRIGLVAARMLLDVLEDRKIVSPAFTPDGRRQVLASPSNGGRPGVDLVQPGEEYL